MHSIPVSHDKHMFAEMLHFLTDKCSGHWLAFAEVGQVSLLLASNFVQVDADDYDFEDTYALVLQTEGAVLTFEFDDGADAQLFRSTWLASAYAAAA